MSIITLKPAIIDFSDWIFPVPFHVNFIENIPKMLKLLEYCTILNR